MAQQVTQSDFFATFYASEQGRKVLVWLEETANAFRSDTPELAYGKVCLLELIADIKQNAGVTTAMKIEAEFMAAAQYQETTKPETTDLLGE